MDAPPEDHWQIRIPAVKFHAQFPVTKTEVPVTKTQTLLEKFRRGQCEMEEGKREKKDMTD